MANELADFDEQLDEIINLHKVKKSKEKRQLKKKEFKTQNIEKINSLKYEKLIRKSNQTFIQQILNLFHEENFCDLIIECDKFFKYAHSCIFSARIPILFELLKENFIVGKDTSLVPVFQSNSTNSSTVHLNSFENKLDNNLSTATESDLDQQQEDRSPLFIHVRLPSELSKIYNLVGFIESIYSEDNIEEKELELITILDKIKVLKDQDIFSLENYYKLTCEESMIKDSIDNHELMDCKMKVEELICENEPLYINVNEKLANEVQLNDLQNNNQQLSNQTTPTKNESIKKDKTFLLSKINLENEEFEINLLNEDDDEIANKLANIDNEIKEMENQIDSVDKLSSLDPENEEQQLITALSNEKIEIVNELNQDEVYGNVKQKQRDTTDTVSDVSEICDEFSINSDVDQKYSDSLNIKNLNLGEIDLKFEKKKKQEENDRAEGANDNVSLFDELINIENKVKNLVKEDGQNKSKNLVDSNQIYSSCENDPEDKTLSAAMVRSGTFDLQCQTPINKIIENKLKSDLTSKFTESEDDSSLSRKIEADSLMSNLNTESNRKKSADKKTKKQQDKEQINPQNKMFQYFFDENQIIKKQKEIDEMEQSITNLSKQNSGLFFVELDDPRLSSSMSKSSTFDRKKSKLNQKTHLNESIESSSLNSSFISDHKEENLKKDPNLLPMSMIVKKDCSPAEKLNQSLIESSQGIFRLGNHYKTLSGTNLVSSNRPSSFSTLRTNMLKKTKSEVHQSHPNDVNSKKLEDNEFFIKKSLFSNSRLGEDILKLFVNQINCDFTVFVSDKTQQLKAHKCILSARSEYFARKFSENIECNHLNLIDFSYDSVYFVLCHIYSGTINIPNFNDEERQQCIISNNLNSYNNITYNDNNELNLAELLSLSDLLQLSILKDVILFEIKRTYCHHFHKPCNDCISGVINCLNLAQKCEIPSLYNQCINWICRNYKKIWSTKQFASLFNPLNSPRSTPTKHNQKYLKSQLVHKNNEIIDSIYQSILDSSSNENVIDRILSLQQLAASMTRLKWNEMIFLLIEELIEDCCKYLATNFDQIVSSKTFIQLGKDKTWQLDILENYLIKSISLMKSEIACRTFIQLENIMVMCESINENNYFNTNLDNLGMRLIKLRDGDNYPIYANTYGKDQFSDEFLRLVQKMSKSVERYLIQNAQDAVYCESWNQLSKQTQDHIKKTAVLVFEFEKPLARRPVLSSSSNKSRQLSADKQTNGVKRKNISSAKKSTSNDEKSSDQSRQSTLTKQSARELKNLKDKILKNTEDVNLKQGNDKEDTHIYDEVPLDLVNEIKAKNITAEYSKPLKKQPVKAKSVAQVQPFHVLPADLSMSNITTSNLISNSGNYENYEELIELMDNDNFENNYEKIIYDESISLQKIGSESSLNSSCLAEAENLEQELTKKVQNQPTSAIKKCKLQQSQQIKNTSPSVCVANIGSPQLRTSLRVRNRQSANSVNSTSSSITNSTTSSSSKTKQQQQQSIRALSKKPPFK